MTDPPVVPEAPSGESTPADSGFMRHTLPVGTLIGGLEITGLIGEGGFGIVYLAFDPTLQRQVALKEYMPSSLASRSATSSDVAVKSPRHLDTFNAGLRSFVNEARLLAHFDHPALVKVHQFWQANRTAYMVMPYYQGPTLKAALREMADAGRTPDEATLRRWLTPLLDALELLHSERCFHRDVAPDNILLTANGPLLLDFGAARRVISDMTHALTVMLKPGYAPIEQYGEAASMAQGPWTDLYALASCVYFAITGHSPITSVERVMGDPLPALARIAEGRYSEGFLRAIDHALAVRPKDRPQSVAAFRLLLDSATPHATPTQPVNEATRAPAPAAPARAHPVVPEPPPHSAAPAPGSSRANAMSGETARRAGESGNGAKPETPRARRALVWAASLAVALGVVFLVGFFGRQAVSPSLPPAATGDVPSLPATTGAAAGTTAKDAPKAVQASDPAKPAPAGPSVQAPTAAPIDAQAQRPLPVPNPKPAPQVAQPATRSAAPAQTRAPGQAPAPQRVKAQTPVAAETRALPRGSPEAARPVPSVDVRPATVPAEPARSSVERPAGPAAGSQTPLPKTSNKPPRCEEILQKGAKQPLSMEEIGFLRQECR